MPFQPRLATVPHLPITQVTISLQKQPFHAIFTAFPCNPYPTQESGQKAEKQQSDRSKYKQIKVQFNLTLSRIKHLRPRD